MLLGAGAALIITGIWILHRAQVLSERAAALLAASAANRPQAAAQAPSPQAAEEASPRQIVREIAAEPLRRGPVPMPLAIKPEPAQLATAKPQPVRLADAKIPPPPPPKSRIEIKNTSSLNVEVMLDGRKLCDVDAGKTYLGTLAQELNGEAELHVTLSPGRVLDFDLRDCGSGTLYRVKIKEHGLQSHCEPLP